MNTYTLYSLLFRSQTRCKKAVDLTFFSEEASSLTQYLAVFLLLNWNSVLQLSLTINCKSENSAFVKIVMETEHENKTEPWEIMRFMLIAMF